MRGPFLRNNSAIETATTIIVVTMCVIAVRARTTPASGVNLRPSRVSREMMPRYRIDRANDHENENSPANVDLILAPKIEKLSMKTNIDPVSAASADYRPGEAEKADEPIGGDRERHQTDDGHEFECDPVRQEHVEQTVTSAGMGK